MGFNNPGVPWSEMERVLSGRRRPDARPVGADGAAWLLVCEGDVWTAEASYD